MKKYNYELLITGRKVNITFCFSKQCNTKKDLKILVDYYTNLGFNVEVEKYLFIERMKFKKKIKEYKETDAYLYDGDIHERKK